MQSLVAIGQQDSTVFKSQRLSRNVRTVWCHMMPKSMMIPV